MGIRLMRRWFGTRIGTAGRVGAAVLLAATVAAGAGLVAGCGGGTSASSSAGGAAARPNAGGYGAGSGAGSTNGTSDGAAAGSSATSGAHVADTQNLIIMAALQAAVNNPDQAARSAEQAVVAAGGYVAGEAEGIGPQTLPGTDTSADASDASYTGISPLTLPAPDAAPKTEQAILLLRVPPAQLPKVLAALPGGGKVAYHTESRTDVTGKVADVSSRVASAQASITELRGLIDKAASMNDLISLEQALADRESDLEALEAQQRALAGQVAYATVTVGYFVDAGTPVATASPHRSPFVAGLVDSWHALIALGRALLAAAGWLLPFAVLAALLWWPLRRVGRTWRQRRTAHPTE